MAMTPALWLLVAALLIIACGVLSSRFLTGSHTLTLDQRRELMKWLDILKVVGPIVAMSIPGAQPLVPVIVAAIGEAEAIPGASGAEKKAHVVNVAIAAAEGVNVAAKKQIMDPTTVSQTTSSAIDTIVGVTNLVQQAQK